MAYLDPSTEEALKHIRYLSVSLGGRGSCSLQEREAARYAAQQMGGLGVTDVRLEPYSGALSTYRPYALAFGLAAAGTILAWLFESPWTAAVAALANLLGLWGMLAETDFATNWMRLVLPKAMGHNAVGVIPPQAEVRNRVVLCAHLDTHRTPVFYSSKRWHKVFQYLVAAAFLSLIVGAVAYSLLAIFGWKTGLWIGALAAFVQIVFLDLCLHADSTPFSPGANDNASGVGIILSLAERLLAEPLDSTEVWLAFTGCVEAGAHGMDAFLDAHALELGKDAVYVILDQVGAGRVTYLTSDGLIVKRKTHARALELARKTTAGLPEVDTQERVGIAYTDAAVATKRGLVALTLVALPSTHGSESTHWHQMSDTLDKVDPGALDEAFVFTRHLLAEIDG